VVGKKMIYSEDPELQAIIERVYDHDQGHIFRFWDSLDEIQQTDLLAQVDLIDFSLLSRLIEQASSGEEDTYTGTLEPPEVITLAKREKMDEEAKQIGETALAAGDVAAVLVAGGQGTRLGFDGPKGMYPVTPVMQKSLFQLHAEKLLFLGERFGNQIPWYIMTSLTNNKQTIRYLQQNNYFGYDHENVYVFIQEMIPAIDRQGKMIMDEIDHIFMNPNGHGGTVKALSESGALSDMKERDIDHLFYFQVDNVLTRICDPIYLGYHILGDSEMSCKVVHKKYPEEKMGILCVIYGENHLIEYSDLSDEDMYAKNKDGSMKFWVGNIATHIFDRQFLERENEGGFKLPYHIARKSIPYVDARGEKIKPSDKNGIKFETFVFDALVDAQKTVYLEIEREKEFSPLKNNKGENSPETIKRDLNILYASWLKEAGYDIKVNKDGEPKIDIEISPLVSLTGENLKELNLKITGKEKSLYLD
jgi:UDP-N-acetylglucosamine/UDP-N-acetylgalactosamine diphosphorylase